MWMDSNRNCSILQAENFIWFRIKIQKYFYKSNLYNLKTNIRWTIDQKEIWFRINITKWNYIGIRILINRLKTFDKYWVSLW